MLLILPYQMFQLAEENDEKTYLKHKFIKLLVIFYPLVEILVDILTSVHISLSLILNIL